MTLQRSAPECVADAVDYLFGPGGDVFPRNVDDQPAQGCEPVGSRYIQLPFNPSRVEGKAVGLYGNQSVGIGEVQPCDQFATVEDLELGLWELDPRATQ